MLLAEALENPRQEVRFDADAVIAHDQAEGVAAAPRRELHLTALGRKLDGVAEQVPNNLLQSRRIRFDAHGKGRAGFPVYLAEDGIGTDGTGYLLQPPDLELAA